MFTLTIETDNAAFEDTPVNEVAWILAQLTDSFEYGVQADSGTLRDGNGKHPFIPDGRGTGENICVAASRETGLCGQPRERHAR